MPYALHPRAVGLLALGLLLPLATPAAWGQTSFFLVDEETTVSEVSFKFVGDHVFEADQLQEQIATSAPGFTDRLARLFPTSLFLTPGLYPFDPFTLQKDVRRLELFYERNGFLHPRIDYPASQFDSTENEIHVIFRVEEGPPLIIQDVRFLGPDSAGYAVSQFEGDLRERWIRFRDRNAFQTGERFSDFELTRLRGEVEAWLQNRGYAFARVRSDTTVDDEANTIDIALIVDAGPFTRVSEVEVEGATSVSPAIVRREVPIEVGEPFSLARLNKGQRELFGLNLFRVALAEVPPLQPRDSTVKVLYRVREARLHYVTAQTGYAQQDGVSLQGSWTHRNFFGGARNFTVSAVANTGFLADVNEDATPPRLFRASASLRQPYLFSTSLSAIVSPFIEFQRSPFLPETDEVLGINRRDFGLNTTLIYEIYPFRVVSFQHSLSRALLLAIPPELPEDPVDPVDPDAPGLDVFRSGLFTQSVFTLNGTFGDVDDFLRPERGFLFRPFAEFGGPPSLSAVEYYKLGGSLVGYRPLTRRIGLAGRLFAGRLWPVGESSDQAENPITENLFDPIRFYAGGTSDVRGWTEQFAGAKSARRDVASIVDEDGDGVGDDTTYTYVYEPVGGTAKLGANLEVRLPFPGLGSDWGTALFLDVGYIESEEQPDDFENVPDTDPPVPPLERRTLRLGTGVGLRYNTPIGYVRVDLAYKLNPSYRDLRRAEDVYRYEASPRDEPGLVEPPEPNQLQRFKVHLSIGQSF